MEPRRAVGQPYGDVPPKDDFNVDGGDFDSDEVAWAAEETEWTATFMFLTPDAEERTAKELYAVFRRPRNDADRRAGELARRWGAFDVAIDEDDDEFDPALRDFTRAERAALGEVIEQEGRLVLAGLGGAEDMLYAAPTTTEAIAHAVLPNGGGGCSRPGPDGLILATVNRRESLVVLGLIADAIVAVDVVVNGEGRRARMGENAFGVRIEDAARPLEKLVLHRGDGATNEVGLRMPERGDLDLPPGSS